MWGPFLKVIFSLLCVVSRHVPVLLVPADCFSVRVYLCVFLWRQFHASCGDHPSRMDDFHSAMFHVPEESMLLTASLSGNQSDFSYGNLVWWGGGFDFHGFYTASYFFGNLVGGGGILSLSSQMAIVGDVFELNMVATNFPAGFSNHATVGDL